MKYLWPVLLVVFRTLYFLYSLWCLFFPVAVVWLVLALAHGQTLLGLPARLWATTLLAALAAFAAIVVALVFLRRSPKDPNPFQSAFLSWFGTLRAFWNRRPGDMVKFQLPSGYLVENPQAYRIGGRDMQEVLHHIRPGDILLRGFDGYVDGMLIRRASVCSEKDFQPGWFTHAALYVGTLTTLDRSLVHPTFQHDPHYFQEGSQMLVHAMARGVHCQDLLTFCRSDYLAVLRLTPGTAQLDVAAAIDAARRSALEKIGDSYDFDASDANTFSRFSCSELVFYCLRSVQAALQLTPQPHAIFPLSPWNKKWSLLRRVTIVPDDFYALVRRGAMECVWQDGISARQHQQAA
jgi:Permuted papain-like amidase enzyme, YaeF/YiiX, C92 family